MREKIKILWRTLRSKVSLLTNIREDTDIDATIDSIKKSIEFKGINIWMLAFAIIVASVGLNVNSTAVIIGAMLISPLMGPINGLGLSVGTMDITLFKHSLKNLGTMVLISLIASTTYFIITPLSDAQSELLARTTPTIYDVFIAFFGGAAGILALSRKSQAITTISGVAIATALMPPLCTAGFGLASTQWSYFIGAFYLFFINSFFIALATFLMVRYLHFPMASYVDPRRQQLVKRGLTLFAIIVIVPSVFIAIRTIREASFNTSAIKYVAAIQKDPFYQDVEIVNTIRSFNKKQPSIQLSFVGKQLTPVQVEHLKELLKEYDLEKTQLKIKQLGTSYDIETQSTLISDLLERKEIQLAQRDSIIQELQKQLALINNTTKEFQQIGAEINVQYPNIESFSIANAIYTQTETLKQDTIPVLFINWHNKPTDSITTQRVAEWLKVRLGLYTLKIYETNN